MNTTIERVRRWIGRTEAVSWEAVFSAELPRVYNYFRYQGLEDATAEDLTATTFEKAWRARATYRQEQAGVTTWILTIAKRLLIDYYRAAREETPLDVCEWQASAGPGLEEIAEEREDVRRLRRLLIQLPDRERELVALKYGAQLTNRAIALQTGLSVSNVGTILHRVVQELRQHWEVNE